MGLTSAPTSKQRKFNALGVSRRKGMGRKKEGERRTRHSCKPGKAVKNQRGQSHRGGEVENGSFGMIIEKMGK